MSIGRKKYTCKLVFCVLFSLFFVFFSCDQGVKISSGIVYSSKQKVASPSRIQVSPLILDKSNVMVYWSAVENAEYYILSYYNADEWKAGAKPNEIYIEDRFQTSYRLSLEKDATRYLFFVRACRYDWETNQLVISSQSNYAECVVTPNITVNSQVEDDFLRINFATSSFESLVDSSKMIFTPTFTIYENGEEVASDVGDNGSWVSNNIIKSNASLNYRVELNLPSGVESSGKTNAIYADVDLKSDISYTPFPVKSVDLISNGGKDSVELSFVASPINDGVEGVELVFEITRYEQVDDELVNPVTVYDGRKEDNTSSLVQDENEPLKYSFTDNTLLPSVDYKYHVKTYYLLSSATETGDVFNTYYADKGKVENACSPTAWIQSDIKNFAFQFRRDDSQSGKIIKNPTKLNGESAVEYIVDLSWDVDHFDSSKSFFVIKRLDLNSKDAQEVIVCDKLDKLTFQDSIILITQEDKLTHRYGYEVLYYLDSSSSPVSSTSIDNIRTEGSADEIKFLTDEKVSTPNYNIKKVYVSFKPIDVSILKQYELSEKLLTYYIFRSKTPLGYTTPRYNDAIFSISRDKISGSVIDDDGYYTYCDDNNKAGLESGETYYYAIYGVYDSNSSGVFFGNYYVTNNTILSAQTAAAVQNVTCSFAQTIDAITLSWDTVSAASGYKIYYKPLDTTSAFTQLEGEIENDGKRCKLVLNDEKFLNESGRVYEFKVIAYFDTENGVQYGDFSDVVKGSLFGIYSLNPTVGSIDYDGKEYVNEILVKWDKVENASGYFIEVYSDEELYNLVLQEKLPAVTSYRFSRDKIVADIPYVFSNTYYFVIIPYTIVNLRECKVPIKYAFTKTVSSRFHNSPPRDISASYGEFNDMISLNWEAVPNATSYNVYRREVDENFTPVTDWTCVKSDIYSNAYFDKPSDQSKLYEYTVSSNDKYYNSKVWKQDFFEDSDNDGIKDNIGYVFATPTLFGDEKFISDGKIVFNGVRGAEDYVLKVYNATSYNGREYTSYNADKYEFGNVVEFNVLNENHRRSILEFYAIRKTKSGKEIHSKSWNKCFLDVYAVTDWHNVAMSKALNRMSKEIGGDWWWSSEPLHHAYTIEENGGVLRVRPRTTWGVIWETTPIYKYGLDKNGGGAFSISNYSTCNVVLNVAQTGFKTDGGASSTANPLEKIGYENGGYGRPSSIVFPFGYTATFHYCIQSVQDMKKGPDFVYNWGNYDWKDKNPSRWDGSRTAYNDTGRINIPSMI